MSTSPGETIGRYQIIDELGRGGMATVYRAFDPQVHREVAIKLLPRQFTHDTSFRGRFAREAKIVAALDHPAIVPVLDYGEQGDQPYLVMRLMTGGTLAERLETGPLPLPEIGRIFNRIAPALDAAHARGAIHRDLKPSNILFDQWNEPYIADFGIVKLSESTVSTLSQYALGTPAYMSPEQIEGKAELDGRSDVYALGVILFEMLTGGRPYEATTPMGLMMQHVNEPVPDIRTRLAELPVEGQRIINQAMAKNRDERYTTATALAADMAHLAGVATPTPLPLLPKTPLPGDLPAPIRPVTPTPAPTEVMAPTPRPPTGAKPTPVQPAAPKSDVALAAPNRKVPLWLIGLGGVGALAVLGIIVVALVLLLNNGGSGNGNEENADNNVNTANEENGNSSNNEASSTDDTGETGSEEGEDVTEIVELPYVEWDLFIPFPLPGEPLAADYPVITPDNATDLFELTQFSRGTIMDIEYSPDGEWIGAATPEGIYLYTAADLELVWFQPAIDGQLAFDPQGETIAVSNEGNVELWDVNSGEPVETLPDDQHYTGYALTFSPDGQFLAATHSGGEVQVWGSDGALALTLQGEGGRVYSLAFSPDSDQLAAAGELAILIWDTNSGALQQTLSQSEVGFGDIAYVNDTTLLAGSFNAGVFLWNIADGTLSQSFGTDIISSGAVAASATGLLATGSYDTVALWYEGDTQPRYRFRSEGGSTNNLAFSPDGTILIAGSENHVARWRVDTDPPEPLDVLAAHAGDSRDIAFAPDGQTLAMTTPNTYAYIWQMDNGSLEYTLTNEHQDVFCLSYAPDGGLIIGSFSSVVQGWTLPDEDLQFEAENEAFSYVYDVAVSVDNEWIAAARDNGTILILNRAGRPEQIIPAHDGLEIRTVTFLPRTDITLLASGGDDNTVHLWLFNGDEFELLTTYSDASATVFALVSDGTYLAAGDAAGVVRFYDLGDPSQADSAYVGEFQAEGGVHAMAVSPDAQLLAVSNNNGNVEFWSIPDARVVLTLYGAGGGGIAFAPDGSLLATAGYSGLRLWAIQP